MHALVVFGTCLALGEVSSTVAFADASLRGREVRGIWVTRWDYRTAAEVREIVANCARLGLNRVYFQVRGQADAFYASRLEPWSEELGGFDPGFDPLDVAIAEARRHRVELHAWVNVLAGWKGLSPPRSLDHVVHRHPEWFLEDRSGRRHLLHSHYTMLNPCLPEVRKHIIAVLSDITARYAVDGLHLDYVRFVFESLKDPSAVPHDAQTLALFRRFTGASPDREPRLWDAFRRLSIDALVGGIAAEARRLRPGLVVSAAVVKDFERGRGVFLQDALKWLERGWVDEIVPMSYEREAEVFAAGACQALADAGAGKVLPGIGVHLFSSSGQLAGQVLAARRLGARGYVLFAYADFFPTPSPASLPQRHRWRLREELRAALRRVNDPRTVGPTIGAHPAAPLGSAAPASTPAPCAPGRASGASR
jgi:uncharacterized lipoprotein YddW (UPF0748 family)